MPQLLVVDDEPLILETIRIAFADPDYEVLTAKNAESAVEIFQQNSPDVVLADIRLPDGSGLNLFERLHQLDARVPVILMTGHGSAGTAIDAMRAGAFEYILKPLDPDTLIPLVRSAAETSRMMRVPATLPSDAATVKGGDVLIGDCPAMQEVYRAIGRVAPQNVTVLIRGESGTGKEVVARAIYNYSQRSDRTFLAINCAAIPENLLESELFGHEKGAFTGADRRRIGKFEQCSEGTLFMDEVGDMTPLTQTKVLRALQNQEFERVGGNETIRTNVRLIAATNRNLEEMIEERTFRSDLFYRLNVYTIELPPLRDRGDDVRLLAQHFCAVFAKELDRNVTGLAPETLSLLQKYPWPGNVRELQSVLKHALLESTGPVIVPAFLPESLRNLSAEPGHGSKSTDGHSVVAGGKTSSSQPQTGGQNDSDHSDNVTNWDAFVAAELARGSECIYDDARKMMERHVLSRVLQHADGNQLQAAKLLGVSRATLRTKCRELGITVDKIVDSGVS